MDFSANDLKILVDIGLGAVSLMLWFRQGKVNKAQQEIDAKQNQTAADLTKMVRDHEERIGLLESVPIAELSRRRFRRKKGKWA